MLRLLLRHYYDTTDVDVVKVPSEIVVNVVMEVGHTVSCVCTYSLELHYFRISFYYISI